MRGDALMNGGLIGFGLGFIGATIALYQVVKDLIPQYVTLWQFKGVAIIGGIGLAIGIGFEVWQRMREKKKAAEAEPK